MRNKHGYDHTTGEGQKRMMYESRPFKSSPIPTLTYYQEGEYGSDPILDSEGNPTGLIRMVPTGRVVDLSVKK